MSLGLAIPVLFRSVVRSTDVEGNTISSAANFDSVSHRGESDEAPDVVGKRAERSAHGCKRTDSFRSEILAYSASDGGRVPEGLDENPESKSDGGKIHTKSSRCEVSGEEIKPRKSRKTPIRQLRSSRFR